MNKLTNRRIVFSLRRKAAMISFLNELTTGVVSSIDDPESPPWFEPGAIYQVCRTTYLYHAESTCVRWVDRRRFVFAVDLNPFQLFWSRNTEFFGRQLTESETFRFCQLTDVKRYT